MGNNAMETAKMAAGATGGNVSDAAKTAAERVGVIGNNANETRKVTGEYVKKDAGHLLGNAREQLGDKIEKVGKGLKPEDE